MARVNLIPPIRRRERRRPRIAIALGRPTPEVILGAIGTLLLAGFITAFVVERRALSEARAAVVEAQADSTRLRGVVTRVERIQRTQARLAERIEILEGVVDGRHYWLRFMETLSRSLPPYVWLELVDRRDLGPEEIRIAGASFANGAITDFMRDLESSEELRDVRLVQVSRSRRDSLDVQQFTLVAAQERRPVPEVVPDSTAVKERSEVEAAEKPGEEEER